ncbi:MAG: hypothetical protein WCT23_01210, partial [Candidatus Neomarinimicrobiota bacterium]
MLLTGAHILLIEQDPRVIEDINLALKKPFELDVKLTAHEGIKQGISKEYDIYLIATKLNDQPGLEVLSQIR